MSVSTMPDTSAQVEQVQGETAFYRPSTRHERVRLTPEQQEAFDRAFKKREAKVRNEYEPMRKDLLDTAVLAAQLLGICSDRISVADQRAIRNELNNIRLAYGGKQCRNPQQK